ncbi:hypothetical protein J5N97_008983 [Dioscorea zingiberensis]|uniref:ARM repeat superfamily protein n=1 Tax=Dioscorea zingiberensis TaxID=325984 RepID=A0A9D5CWQ9_9LILI|nr:hypothetical protein J5N97_008983 [Dioscorea zingiberensis]
MSIILPIINQQPSGDISTFFEPQGELARERTEWKLEEQYITGTSGSSTSTTTKLAPEKKLTLFALRLAILEKAASGIGALGFIWATVVLLGGFAITLEKKDFWFITVILLIEGTRIFSRSHELEWQHQATWSVTEAGRASFRKLRSGSRSVLQATKAFISSVSILRSGGIAGDVQRVSEHRTWRSPEVPLLPYAGWIFLSRNISKILYWLQLFSASACVVLSLMRLVQQDFGDVRAGESDKKNRKSALNIFYALAFAEALMFLMEKAYWEWKVSHCRILEEVNKECDLGAKGMISIKRFFYDSYSRCVNGSIFDGLKMDLVTFAEELLASSSHDEQLIGANILLKFATNLEFSDETLRKLGTSTPAMERLLEMLNWKSKEEEELRRSAAVITLKLASKKQNALRVAGIPGAMESISSLLYTGRGVSSKPDEICHRCIIVNRSNYEFSVFNLYGLLILKKLSRDHDNCGKIGNTRGLLAKIIDFSSTGEWLLGGNAASEQQIRAVKSSLQVTKMLASTTGNTGKNLRREIAEIVFTVSNIREILQFGEKHLELQKLGIEILTSLAMDELAKEKIGGTGGMIKELVRLFFRPPTTGDHSAVSIEAGEALTMLALENKMNCDRILKEDYAVERFVVALSDPVLQINSSRILRNLCAYTSSVCYSRLRGVIAAIPSVLNCIMFEEMKLLEVSLGLAVQIFRITSNEEYIQGLETAEVDETSVAGKMVAILKKYDYPSIKVPRIRRFVVELAIWMMKSNQKYIEIFKEFGMEKELEGIAETTTELECFNVFSGSVGLSRHCVSLYGLVDSALELMAEG